jgi:hypothetical protein
MQTNFVRFKLVQISQISLSSKLSGAKNLIQQGRLSRWAGRELARKVLYLFDYYIIKQKITNIKIKSKSSTLSILPRFRWAISYRHEGCSVFAWKSSVKAVIGTIFEPILNFGNYFEDGLWNNCLLWVHLKLINVLIDSLDVFPFSTYQKLATSNSTNKTAKT